MRDFFSLQNEDFNKDLKILMIYKYPKMPFSSRYYAKALGIKLKRTDYSVEFFNFSQFIIKYANVIILRSYWTRFYHISKFLFVVSGHIFPLLEFHNNYIASVDKDIMMWGIREKDKEERVSMDRYRGKYRKRERGI